MCVKRYIQRECFSHRSLLITQNKTNNAHRYWFIEIHSAMGLVRAGLLKLTFATSSAVHASKFKWKSRIYMLLLNVLATMLEIPKPALFTSQIFSDS